MLALRVFAADGDAFSPTAGKYYSIRQAASTKYATFSPTVTYGDDYVLSGHDGQETTWGFSAFTIEAVEGEDGYFTIALQADPSLYVYAMSGTATSGMSDYSSLVKVGEKPEDGFTDAYKWKIVEATPANGGQSNTETKYIISTKLATSNNIVSWNFYGGYSESNPYIRLYSRDDGSPTLSDWGSVWVIAEANAWDATSECTEANNNAKTKLDKLGVGWPKKDTEARTTLNNVYDNASLIGTEGGAWVKWKKLVATTEAYSLIENVLLPEDGHVYKVYVQFSDGTKYPVMVDSEGQNYPIKSLNEDDAETQTLWVAQEISEGKYKLAAASGENTLYFHNAAPASYADADQLTIASTQFEGCLSLYGHTPHNTGDTQKYLAATNDLSGSNKGWEQLNEVSQSYENNSVTSSATFVFEEVEFEGYELNIKTLVTSAGATQDWEKGKYFATIHLPYAVTIPSDVKVYGASMNEERSMVTLNEMTLTDNVLPFETPVMVCASESGIQKLAPAEYSAPAETGFDGVLYKREVTATGTPYIFATKNSVAMFYKLKSGSKLAANRAYIDVSNSVNAAALRFVFEDPETTGIQTITPAKTTDSTIYDLSGRRVVAPTKGGVYIQNGKKVIF